MIAFYGHFIVCTVKKVKEKKIFRPQHSHNESTSYALFLFVCNSSLDVRNVQLMVPIINPWFDMVVVRTCEL